tara:strand:- start:3405 stop:4412 length:1008 start_codon:yes stop_codon:yes gene_type:complete
MQKITPLISLIMPVYNHEKFVERAILSIIHQTYSNWELIVIDDGSTDGSKNIIENFNDDRIKYFYQKNQGVLNLAKTINKGLALTRGEFVTMVPSDDTWPAERFSIQVPEMLDEKIVISFGKMNLIDQYDNKIGFSNPRNESRFLENKPIGKIFNDLLINNFIGEPTILIRKKYLIELGGYQQPDGMLAEDYPTTLYLACKGNFKFIDHTLANYRFHSSQMTRLHVVDMVEKDKEFILNFFNSIPQNIKNFINFDSKKLGQKWDEKISRSHFSLARRQILIGERKKARKEFYISFKRSKNLLIKLASLIGILHTYLGLNIEWMTLFSSSSIKLRK